MTPTKAAPAAAGWFGIFSRVKSSPPLFELVLALVFAVAPLLASCSEESLEAL